jgi:hypothetical protein
MEVNAPLPPDVLEAAVTAFAETLIRTYRFTRLGHQVGQTST